MAALAPDRGAVRGRGAHLELGARPLPDALGPGRTGGSLRREARSPALAAAPLARALSADGPAPPTRPGARELLYLRRPLRHDPLLPARGDDHGVRSDPALGPRPGAEHGNVHATGRGRV